jgi:hypothetical protein
MDPKKSTKYPFLGVPKRGGLQIFFEFFILLYLEKIHIILQIFSLILLMLIVGKIIEFMCSDKVIAKGLSMLLYISHLFGVVLVGATNYLKHIIN